MGFRLRKQVNTLDGIAIASSALVFGVVIWMFLHLERRFWVDLLTDDAYYYLGVARNLATTGISQFLPPFSTNGYQPLWTWLLTATATVFGTGDVNLAIECYGLSVAGIAAFALLARVQHRAAFPAVLVSFLFFFVMLLGMETVLVPALFIGFMATRHWQLRGVLGALLFLTRLDAIAIPVARDLYRLVTRREIDLRPYLVIVPVVILYAGWNVWLFGVPLPVSGLVKAVNSVLFENARTMLQYVEMLKQAGILLVVAIGLKLAARRSPFDFKYREELVVCLICLVVCAGYYGARSGWAIWGWYLWAPLLLTYYLAQEVLADTVQAFGDRRPIAAALVPVLMVALFAVTGARIYPKILMIAITNADGTKPRQVSFAQRNVELVDWVNANKVPAGTMFAMGDRAGSFGFFLGNDYRFLHTEGLVGSAGYYEALKADRAEAYVSKLGIKDWIADREAFLEDGDVIGMAEPVQALSMHRGPYVICFKRSGIVLDQSYIDNRFGTAADQQLRFVFDGDARVDCPKAIEERFLALRDRYNGLRAFSLRLERRADGPADQKLGN